MDQKEFLDQNNFFGLKIFFRPKFFSNPRNSFKLKFILTQNFFWTQDFYGPQTFYQPKIFFEVQIFFFRLFSNPNFKNQYFFRTNILIGQNVLTQNFFDPYFCLQFFWCPKFFFFNSILDPQMFLALQVQLSQNLTQDEHF